MGGLGLFARVSSVPFSKQQLATDGLRKAACCTPGAVLLPTQPSLSPAQRRQQQRGVQLSCRAAGVTDLEQMIQQKNEQTPVVIYSKSYCPFSGQVKSLFKNAGVEFKAFELDQIEEGEDILDSLVGITGSRTVPQVFVKSQYIGGCDDTMDKHRTGKLVEIFEKAGIKSKL